MLSNFTRFLLFIAILNSSYALADTIEGHVVGVTDGDTVTVLDASNSQWKIRLMGIDAPEKKQAFGQRSKEYLSSLVFGKQVTVEYSKRDKYGRTVGKILINGSDANLEQIKSGLAWHYKKYAGEQTPVDRQQYSDFEKAARESGRGLWSDTGSIPPWDWRKQKKERR